MSKYPIDCCPKCGNDEFYIRQRVSGIIDYNCKLDGSIDAYNGDQFDHLSYEDYK